MSEVRPRRMSGRSSDRETRAPASAMSLVASSARLRSVRSTIETLVRG